MNKYLLGLVGAFVVGAFLGYILKPSPALQPPLGASSGNEHYNAEVFYNTVTEKNQVFGNLSSSSSTPTTTLSSLANSGHLTVGANQTFQSASTTAIDANSTVTVQLEQTTPIGGTTCNTNLVASATEATSIFASSTNTSLNGFTIKVANAPITNPFCFDYKISN